MVNNVNVKKRLVDLSVYKVDINIGGVVSNLECTLTYCFEFELGGSGIATIL